MKDFFKTLKEVANDRPNENIQNGFKNFPKGRLAKNVRRYLLVFFMERRIIR
jgi:hypothetical protein